MDNRKVFRSYREKSKQISSPYPTGDGFLSKVKQFFKNSSWSLSSQSTDTDEKSSNKGDLKPFTYPVPDNVFRTPLKKSSKNEVEQTPNKILSEFFNSKGDKPITEIEYEGVLSLLSKTASVSSTPIKHEDSKKLSTFPNKNENITLEPNTSKIITTPYQQKALRKGPKDSSAIFSTPEYRPVYHSVNNSFNSKNSVPSVKRVYQFSGLPSPYRTRIKAPSSVPRSKKSKVDMSSTSLLSSQPTPKKPSSQTANKLLSMLDENNSSENMNREESKIKNFSNPYANSQFKRSRNEVITEMTPSKKKATQFSANDINSTLAFDRTEELPHLNSNSEASNSKNPLQASISSTSQKIEKDNLKSKSFGLFESQDDKVSKTSSSLNFSFNSPSEAPKKAFTNFVSDKESQALPENNTQHGKVPSLSSFNFNFSEKQNLEKKTEHSKEEKNEAPSFSFSADKTPSVSTKIKADEIVLPEVIPVFATLDQAKVQVYKNIFEF